MQIGVIFLVLSHWFILWFTLWFTGLLHSGYGTLTSAKDADGRGVVVAVDAPDDDLEWRPGDVDAVELGVQVVHALLLRHKPERITIR